MFKEPMTKTLLIFLKYRGTAFHGFARQTGLLTVQGSLEEALSTLFARKIETICAGRTDAGVHAHSQAVSFALDETDSAHSDIKALIRSLNALSHRDIVVTNMRILNYDFSARFDAKSRTYRYRICNQETPPLFSADYVWHVAKPLNWDDMKQAAQHFIGEHDFIAFAASASTKEQRAQGLSTCRRISHIKFFGEHILDEVCQTIEIKGNAFLHSMVRTMVGTLVEIGQGKRDVDDVVSILKSKDRSLAGQNAPACGLMLYTVDYLLDHPQASE